MPSAQRWASRSHWCGSSGASVAQMTMIEPETVGIVLGQRDDVRAEHAPDWEAADGEPVATPVIGLHEHADRPLAGLARGGAEAALEAMADHAGATTGAALAHGAVRGIRECLVDVLGPDVEAVDVVERAVPRLADHRQAPEHLAAVVLTHLGLDERVAHDADAVRVGEADRRGQAARLADPLEPGQLAVAVQAMAAGEQRLEPLARHDDGDAGAHGALAAAQRAVTLDQRDRADADALDVGDRVEWPGLERAEREAEIAGSGPGHWP